MIKGKEIDKTKKNRDLENKQTIPVTLLSRRRELLAVTRYQ